MFFFGLNLGVLPFGMDSAAFELVLSRRLIVFWSTLQAGQ
jgi:hypothetical protein